jgi:hypothetical protein
MGGRKTRAGWGDKVVDRLSYDPSEVYPGMNGLSPRSLLFMRAFAGAHPDPAIVKQLVSRLPRELKGSLLRVEEIEAELSHEDNA